VEEVSEEGSGRQHVELGGALGRLNVVELVEVEDGLSELVVGV
jgi:hypothetical protein